MERDSTAHLEDPIATRLDCAQDTSLSSPPMSPSTPSTSSSTHTYDRLPARVPLSPFTHLAIFASVLFPVALLPYLAVRRSLLSLHRQLGDLSAANAALQRDLKTALLEASVRREEHERLRAVLTETRRELEGVKRDGAQRELERARGEERDRRDIQDLLVERQRTRAGMSTLRDLSSSLADIAAFMHEVEVQQGFVTRKNDGRGIERIRQMAYKLQGIPAVDREVSDSTGDEDVRKKSGSA